MIYAIIVLLWIVLWFGILMKSPEGARMNLALLMLFLGIPMGFYASGMEQALVDAPCINVYGEGFARGNWNGTVYCAGMEVQDGTLADVRYVLEVK